MILALLACAFGIHRDVVPPTDPFLVYVGRFDWTDKTAPVCEWPACEVRMRVLGPSITANMVGTNGCSWQVVIDDKPAGVITLQQSQDHYTIDLGGPGLHRLSLVRRSEPFLGPTTIKGFEVPGGRLLYAKTRTRHIEFVGDSITCGYGNEGKDQNEHFKPGTENAYQSYASITGRLLNADVEIIAWSGRKMWPDNTTPEIYDLVTPTKPTPVYDFKGPVPSAIVINLATNDFYKGPPDEDGWTAAYEAFIRRLWTHYPKAQIYATSGSMMYGANMATLKQYLQKIKADMNDPRVHLLDFGTQNAADGYGSDWHPSIATDQKMAATLAAALKRDLGW